MKIAHTIDELRAIASGAVGFVPTMGALHEGHLSLFRAAAERGHCVVGSIFVNPLQFGPNEDYDRYPRTFERDCQLAESAGCDVLYVPEVSEIYPRISTRVVVPGLSDVWEGKARPGHFDGVATVVAKLFNIVRPNTAYFGQKDLQQCLVIRRMVEDLRMPVALSFVPTVREFDGLALSSRNVYLNDSERTRAPQLYASLLAISKSRNDQELAGSLDSEHRRLSDIGFFVDYLECVDIEGMDRSLVPNPDCAIIGAVRLGNTRLIDNILLVDGSLSA